MCGGYSKIISINVKRQFDDLYESVKKLQPVGMGWSTWVFTMISEWYRIKQSGVTDFFQPQNIWNSILEKMSDEEYKKFYEQLEILRNLERVHTRKRLNK